MSLAEVGYGLPNFFGTLAVMQDLKRFGRIVRERREELGFQQEDMDQHGGPSSTTMSRIERGVAPPSAKTLRKLDTGLDWQTDSAKRTLDGGDPIPLAPGTTTQKPFRPVGQTSAGGLKDPEDVASLINMASKLISAMEMLSGLSNADTPDISPEAREKMGLSMDAQLRAVGPLLVMACEVVGESLAAEDVGPGFVPHLDRYVDQLTALRDIARRVATIRGGADVAEPAPEPDASSQAGQEESAEDGEDWTAGWSPPGDEDPGVRRDKDGEQRDQL